MVQQCPCELISWSMVNRLARDLAAKVRKARFDPDVVVAIARGGYVPARLLCDYLDLTDLSSIRIVHYAAAACKKIKAELVEGLSRDLRGKRVLLVDDISDTGDTLEVGRAHLKEQGAAVLRTAVLHHKQTSIIVPDFFGRRIIKWRWITYPWAVIEDVSEFIERLPNRPADAGEVAWQLQQDYGLRVSRSLVEEILAMK